ncbi:MAG: phosphoenolpyruvate synthase [Planctomycetota bacterium]|jgi:pyruvate,water dikinase|nr:phosphoenolpyruvate synthase [Planctomycetota bacterium]
MPYTLSFNQIGLTDLPLVGGKCASLGEMVTQLGNLGVRVPSGFAVSVEAYQKFLAHNKLEEFVRSTLAELPDGDLNALEQAGASIRAGILDGDFPEEIREQVTAAYQGMEEEYGTNCDVAVRSSATAEDLPNASFAGQQESYLNIRGPQNLMEAVKRVFASLFTNRAISYRNDQNFPHDGVLIAVAVQKMVRSDRASSGVIFTLDTESGFRDIILINSAWGLGENVVQGTVNPDEFRIFKPALRQGKRPILSRRLGEKALKMVYSREASAGASVRNVPVSKLSRNTFSLQDHEVLELSRFALAIEDHYSKHAGKDTPMDIEWAKDGQDGRIYILQARPETVHSGDAGVYHEVFQMKEHGAVVTEGRSVGKRIAAGRARVILDAEDMHQLQPGEVLVTDITDPDWEPIMKIASALVTNRGGRTCHAAIIARELGIPAVVGTGDCTETMPDGEEVTVSCAEGETGFVYEGRAEWEMDRYDLTGLEKPKTDLYLNVADPDQALHHARLPAEGIGLARLEFIINNSIRVHPRALLEYENLADEVREEVDPAIAGYSSPRDYFVLRLAEGIGTIAAAFYPRPVVVRTSDFKSNEYAALLGGHAFEPIEENPMIGFRGASRYYSEEFEEAFALECDALREVREGMGLTNVIPMIPFVRTVEEGKQVLDLMARHGLRRGERDLKVYLMCELPVNALLADEFLEHFDGMSIGSNDMTQLTLGVDRDSGLLTGFDERNGAVLKMMEMAIFACKAKGKYIGICGQAPSDFPEITQWLVERGIDTISLNPDSLVDMLKVVHAAEKKASGASQEKVSA